MRRIQKCASPDGVSHIGGMCMDAVLCKFRIYAPACTGDAVLLGEALHVSYKGEHTCSPYDNAVCSNGIDQTPDSISLDLLRR